MSEHVFASPVLRARARLDLVLTRLATAKDAANPVPIEPADAEALYAVVFEAGEDLSELVTPKAPTAPGRPFGGTIGGAR